MKHFIILLIIFAFSNITYAQTEIILNDGTSLSVPIGAEICAETIRINPGGSLILEDPSGICSGAIIIQSVGPVVYDNHLVDDDNLQGSSGNGDGIINPGELIELFVDLHNSGQETALDVNVSLSDDSPYTTFTSNTTDDYGDIIAGGTATNTNDFDIQINPSTPDGHLITFSLEITASNGGPWADQFSINVVHTLPLGPVIYDNHLVDDDNLQGSSGNGDGIINPGELIELFVGLHNSGQETAINVSASLSDDSPYTAFTSNTTANYGNIIGGGTTTSTSDFDIQIDPSTPDGHLITFTLEITASNGGPWTGSFSETVVAGVPDINVVPDNYDYGNTPLGSSSLKTFVVENTDTADLNVTLTDLIGTNSGEFSIDNGGSPFTVESGGSHNVEVSFNPTSEGSKICTLRIRSNDPDEDPKDVPLTGMGVLGIPVGINPDNDIARCDKDIMVPIVVGDLTGQGIISFEFTIKFDNTILTSADGFDINGDINLSDWQVFYNALTPGEITVAGISTTALGGNGVFLYLLFHTSNDDGVTSPLNFTNFIFNTGTPPALTTNGSITLECCKCGDADADEQVLAFDASLTVQHVIGLITLSDPNCVDVDENGMLQAFDASLILHCVIGLIPPVPACCSDLPLNNQGNYLAKIKLDIEIEEIYHRPEETVAVLKLIGFNNTEKVSAIQFDLELPGGETILEIFELPKEYLSGINKIENNIYRVGIVNPYGIDASDIKLALKSKINIVGELVQFSNIFINSQKQNDINTLLLGAVIPQEYSIAVYPNPFNPSTRITYTLPVKTNVEIKVFDMLGREVITLLNESKEAGRHDVEFNTASVPGGLKSGVYFSRIKAGSYIETKKIILLR